MKRLSIIIINYNTFKLTCDCIRSVIGKTRETNFELILVDNASTECDPELFLKEFPSVKLVKSPTNCGFAAGNNLGIQQAAGEYILLLNSDTILQEDSISKTLEYLIQQPGAGIVGCRMVYPDGFIQYTARRFRSISWELLDLFRFIPYIMPYKKRARKMLGKYFQHDEDMACDWLSGAFFLFPKKLLESMPGNKLDERFFMYGEDQLWCWQAGKLGYKILFYAGTTITHIHSGSTDTKKQLSLRRTMMKNELEIIKVRKSRGTYYYIFAIIYKVKEGFRNLIKRIIYHSTGEIKK